MKGTFNNECNRTNCSNTHATWLILIDPKDGKPRPAYIEQEIMVFPFKMH